MKGRDTVLKDAKGEEVPAEWVNWEGNGQGTGMDAAQYI